MRVVVTGVGIVAGREPGAVPDFSPRDHVPQRKHLKLMTRGVMLGVAAVGRALGSREGWEVVAPERRGLFTGATPVGTDPEDLLPALEASGPDEARFGERGVPLVPPLWLVKGLSNNVLGFASAYFDLRGPNGNRCEGRASGLAAIVDGARAVAEGRVDLAIAGGSDSLLGAEAWLDAPAGEGAAFFVLEPEHVARGAPVIVDVGASFAAGPPTPASRLGELGAATGPVVLARRLLAGDRGFRLAVTDPSGIGAWVEIG